MTTDNRTNVQIVADALRSMPEAERDDDRDPAVVVAEYAVAALVAAQGAAPQAECDCGAGPGSAVCKKVCATRAPVLPSSGVDEDALVQRIRAALNTTKPIWSPQHYEDIVVDATREWLKEQGGESRGK